MEGEVGSERLNYAKFIYLWYSLINSIHIMMVIISHMSYYVPIHCDVVLLKVYPAEVHLQVYEPCG